MSATGQDFQENCRRTQACSHEEFACAPSTRWTVQTSPATGWCSWPAGPGNAFRNARTGTCVWVSDGAELDGSELDASFLCFCQFHLFPQAFDQLGAPNLDGRHVCGLTAALSSRVARVAWCFFFPMLIMHRKVYFRLALVGNLKPANMTGH